MTTDRRHINNLIDHVNDKHYKRRSHLGNSYDKYLAIQDINKSLKVHLVDIHNNNLYEIYTCNDTAQYFHNQKHPAGTVTGWDIKWVLAPNGFAIKQYPFFDCIISVNDNSTGQAIDAEVFTPHN